MQRASVDEFQETKGNTSLPPTLEASLQRALTQQSNVETVARIFPMHGRLLRVRGGMTRSELADYEAICKRIKTDSLLTDPNQHGLLVARLR